MDSEDENDFSQESEEEEDDTSSVEDSSDNNDDDNNDDDNNDSDDEAKTIEDEEEEEEEDMDEGETEDEDEEGEEEEEEEEIEEIEEDETPKPQIDIGSPVKTLPVIVPVNVPVTAPSVGSKLSVVPLVPPTPKTISKTIPMAVPKIPKSLLSPVTPATTLAPVKSPIVPAPVSPVPSVVSPISTQPISTQPPKITETAQKKPESAPVGMIAEELKKLKITQLKDILRTMKLKLGGKKDELIDRILSSGKAYEKSTATQPIVKLATKKRVEQPIVIQEPKTLEELLVKNDTETQMMFDMRRMYAHAAMSVYNNQINPATAVLIGKMATNKALYGVTYPAEEDAIVNYINSVIMGQ